jgi:hypothetical protein
MIFILRRFYTCRNSTGNKNGIVPLSYLSQTRFLGKEWSKNVPCLIFIRFEMVFLETAPKMSSKRTKNIVKKSTCTSTSDVFLLFKYFSLIFLLLKAAL